jgi:hypothetical protein
MKRTEAIDQFLNCERKAQYQVCVRTIRKRNIFFNDQDNREDIIRDPEGLANADTAGSQRGSVNNNHMRTDNIQELQASTTAGSFVDLVSFFTQFCTERQVITPTTFYDQNHDPITTLQNLILPEPVASCSV